MQQSRHFSRTFQYHTQASKHIKLETYKIQKLLNDISNKRIAKIKLTVCNKFCLYQTKKWLENIIRSLKCM